MFSLNFSSAGKGPFVDSKAKNIYFSKRGEGGQWSEGHGPAVTGKFFIPIFEDLLYERSQKSSPQEARKLPQASRRCMKFFISVNLKDVCSVCCLFVTTPFYSVDTNSLCGSKR